MVKNEFDAENSANELEEFDINIKGFAPMSNTVITTLDVWETDMYDENGLITDYAGTYKDYQKVLFAGPNATDLKPGDLVLVDLRRFEVHKHQEGGLHDGVVTDNPIKDYNLDMILIDGKPCLRINTFDIIGVITDYDVKYPSDEAKARKAGYII